MAVEGDTATDVSIGFETTRSDNVVVTTSDPLAPLIVIEYVPAAAVGLTVKLTVLVPDPAIDVGERVAVTPDGKPEIENATIDVKPLFGATVIVLEPEAPWLIDSVIGLAVTPKLPELGVTLTDGPAVPWPSESTAQTKNV